MLQIYKKNLRIILAVVFLILFILLTIFVLTENTYKLNDVFYSNIIRFKSNNLTKIFKIYTVIAGKTFVLILILTALIFLKNKSTAIFLALGSLAQAALNFLIKIILKIPRPDNAVLIIEEGYGYPSGHSMCAMFVYGYIIYLINNQINKKCIKTISNIFMPIVILFVGISRVYLGVHSISDVVAGFLLGLVFLLTYIQITEKLKDI